MLGNELDLVKSLTATLASFKETPIAPSKQRSKSEDGQRDPDVWPPPTPVEQRYSVRGVSFSCL